MLFQKYLSYFYRILAAIHFFEGTVSFSGVRIWSYLVWQRIFRSSHRWCSVKKGVIKKFANFTGKHPFWNICERLLLNFLSVYSRTLVTVKQTFFSKQLYFQSRMNYTETRPAIWSSCFFFAESFFKNT